MATAFCHRLEKQNGSEQLLPLPIRHGIRILSSPSGRPHRERKSLCVTVYVYGVWVYNTEKESDCVSYAHMGEISSTSNIIPQVPLDPYVSPLSCKPPSAWSCSSLSKIISAPQILYGYFSDAPKIHNAWIHLLESFLSQKISCC